MPIYTYRCWKGHEWEEVRTVAGSETSEDLCAACLEAVDGFGVELSDEDLRDFAGRKVPSSSVSVKFKGAGSTPTFYPNRRENK